jgi:hypothetical protein
MTKAAKLFKNEQIRKASEMKNPPKKMVSLNPILKASLTPNESIENMARPSMGKTSDIVERVTLSSYCFKYAAM